MLIELEITVKNAQDSVKRPATTKTPKKNIELSYREVSTITNALIHFRDECCDNYKRASEENKKFYEMFFSDASSLYYKFFNILTEMEKEKDYE